METTILLDDKFDTETEADNAIQGIVGEYTSMTAENGQTIVDTGNGAGLLTVSKEFMAELGLYIVRVLLLILGVPYPLIP